MPVASAFGKEVRRQISSSLGRFLAIAIMAALGCGFYAGLRMTPIDMALSADSYLDETNSSDLRVASSLGLDEDSLDLLRGIEGVSGVQGQRRADAFAQVDGSRYVVRVHELDMDAARASDCSSGAAATSGDADYIDRPVLVEGAWPAADDECVLGADAVLDHPAAVGLTVEIVQMKDDVADTFVVQKFKVVGLVRSSAYLSTSDMGSSDLGDGNIDDYLYVGRGAFADDVPYASALVTVAGAKELSYPSDAYDARVGEVAGRIEALKGRLADVRLSSVKADAQAQLDEKKADFERERDEANKKLDEAKAQLDSSKAELDASEEKLVQGKETLDATRAELLSNQEQLAAKAAELDAARAQLAAQRAQAKEELDAAQAQAGMLSGSARTAALAQVSERRTQAQAEFDAAQAKLDAASAQIEQAAMQLSAGFAAYADGVATSDAGVASWEEGYAKWLSGLSEYESSRSEADAKFADAEREIASAQANIDAVETPDLYVLDRSKNEGTASFKADSERMDKIAQVFPLIFFLVAALVSLTTMTRMVDEERLVIGTHKALGYTGARIASKYLVYALVASLAGCIVGMAALTQFLPRFIIDAYSIVYALPVCLSPIDIPLAALAAGLAIGITLLATLGAVAASLRETPAALLLPRAPKPGKRILLERVRPLWRRFSFSAKVTARNLFRYKQRFFMAVVGIAGCTALLLTGLGLHDGINDIIDKQFGELNAYNLTVQLDEGAGEESHEALNRALSDSSLVERFTQAGQERVLVECDGVADEQTTFVVPADPLGFSDYVRLRERVGGEALSLFADGAIVSEKLASQAGVQVGDTLRFFVQDDAGERTGQVRELRVCGICEYYTGNYAFMTSAVYEEAMGVAPEMNSVFASAPGDQAARTALADELLAIDGVSVASYTDEAIGTYRTMLSTVETVVYVLVAAAALLAFVVLYNLTNINITERVREIATLKVLGFTSREVNMYVFRETLILTVVGALFGCLLGMWMEGFVIQTAEVSQVMFGREIHLPSFAIALALTIGFSLVVTLFMRRKLARIDMVESLKSVE